MIAHPVPRQTLANTATITGSGLFTGLPATIIFKPGSNGLTLSRGGVTIPISPGALDPSPIHPAFAKSPPRSTNLARDSARVATVEHALSALAGLGITDCDVEVQGSEVPILDGSALPFALAVQHAGFRGLACDIEPISITRTIIVEHGSATIIATPRAAPGWSISYTLDYGPGSPLGIQTATWDGSPEAYLKAIAPARTFCMEHEARALKQAGLFQGLTPADMLVIGPRGPIDNAYRMACELAAHKLVDAIGDLTLAGRPIQADLACHRSGHALNHGMAAMLRTNQSS